MLKNSNALTVLHNERLSKYSNFRIGGNAKLIVRCRTIDALLDALNYASKHSIKHKIIGGGTNMLFDDLGFDGMIIKYEADNIFFNGELFAEAGCTISQIIQLGLANNFGGYEFMSGVPTLLGGAVANNFGAYGFDLGSRVMSVTVLKGNQIVYLSPSECGFGYHASKFQNGEDIILSAKLQIQPSTPEKISSEVLKYTKLRGTSQPIAYANCGSVFRREGEVVPAKLIDEAGLKGNSVGDAEVSRLHSGFIINKGNASCRDVLSLIQLVQQKIFDKYGVQLQPEIEYLPF